MHCEGYDIRAYCMVVPTAVSTAFNTVPVTKGPVLSGWDTGTINRTSGIPDAVVTSIVNNTIMSNDMKIRLLRLLIAIEETINQDSLVHQANVQAKRVFLAPEFYFRPPKDMLTDGGEYTWEQFLELKKALGDYITGLKTSSRISGDWLFLCGTCVVDSATHFWNSKRIKNIMLAYLVTPQGVTVQPVRKLCTSDIDGIPTGVDFNRVHNKLVINSPGEVRNHFFSGFDLFVEICLESHLSLMAQHFNTAPVKVHVICAAGLPADSSKTFPSSQAVFIRNDGMLQSPDKMVTFFSDETSKGVYPNQQQNFDHQWNCTDLRQMASRRNLIIANARYLQLVPVIQKAI